MWLLTENLKALTTGRLRRNAGRLTENRFSALAWGALAGAITQSMSAMTFIVMSLLRSGLITPRGSLALILGGCLGLTGLVVIVTFDIKVVSLYVLGLAGAVVASERLSSFRRVAASFLGGAMLILGLVLLKDAAAPLAELPWFQDMLESTGESIALAFAVAAFLTFVVQSSSVVTVLGINLAAVGLISVDQAIMIMYGSLIGSAAILYVLSAGVAGRARQVVMYLVGYNALTCAVLVPLLYCEIHFGIPLVKAAVLALDLEVDQQLAAIYVFLNVFLLPVMLAGLEWSVSVLERLWPTSQAEELSRPQFIHDHASVDVDTSLVLVGPGAAPCRKKPVPVLRCGAPWGEHRAVARRHAEIGSPTSRSSWTTFRHFIPCTVSSATIRCGIVRSSSSGWRIRSESCARPWPLATTSRLSLSSG